MFGSDRNDETVSVIIDHAGLSPRHCQILFHPESLQYSLIDLGSESGTWIRLRSDKGVTLHPGTTICLNDVLLKIETGSNLQDGIEALDEFLR